MIVRKALQNKKTALRVRFNKFFSYKMIFQSLLGGKVAKGFRYDHVKHSDDQYCKSIEHTGCYEAILVSYQPVEYSGSVDFFKWLTNLVSNKIKRQ